MTTLTERIEKLPKARRMRVVERAKALIAEEMSLQDRGKGAMEDTNASNAAVKPLGKRSG